MMDIHRRQVLKNNTTDHFFFQTKKIYIVETKKKIKE